MLNDDSLNFANDRIRSPGFMSNSLQSPGAAEIREATIFGRRCTRQEVKRFRNSAKSRQVPGDYDTRDGWNAADQPWRFHLLPGKTRVPQPRPSEREKMCPAEAASQMNGKLRNDCDCGITGYRLHRVRFAAKAKAGLQLKQANCSNFA